MENRLAMGCICTFRPNSRRKQSLLSHSSPGYLCSPEPRIRFVQDPTERNPTHVIEWEKGRWQLREPSGRLVDLGIVPNVKLARKLLLAVPKSQTFLNVPVSKERQNSCESTSGRTAALLSLTATQRVPAITWWVGLSWARKPFK